MATILIVDDEHSIRIVLRAHIRKMGHVVYLASNGKEALELLRDQNIHLIITDLHMPEMGGMELFTICKEKYPAIPLVILTAYGTVNLAVDAMKKGAADFLSKPFDKDELSQIVDKALKESQARQQQLYEDATGRFAIIGKTSGMHTIYNLIEKVADSSATVLIYGESGTGKELIARALHENSARHSQPFVQINCGAIPEQLFESELFGHEKGAFTGAHQSKPGKFEIANGGSLFLDEIGELPKDMQVKLLRTLQDGSYDRVGGIHSRTADVRLIAATNRDLSIEVSKGHFREDLYYRLNVIPVHVPPLRERKDDISLLADHFVQKFNTKFDQNITSISDDSLQMLMQYDWPGNIRELENIIERAILLSDPQIHFLDLSSLPGSPFSSTTSSLSTDVSLKEYIRLHTAKLEKKRIQEALENCEKNVTHAAKLLGISRKSLQNKMREYGLRDS